MLGYRDGDIGAFEILYSRHKGPLYRYLLRQCHSAALAEEFFQDVWMNLIRARARYEPRAKFSTYLYTLAHNRLVDFYRRQAHPNPVSYDDPSNEILEHVPGPHAEQPEQRADHRRGALRLLALIEQLPHPQREAFLLREEAGLSLEAIAQVTGVTVEAAKSRLRYAVAKLRRGFER